MFILLAMISAQMFTLGMNTNSTGVCTTPVDKLQPARHAVVASANVQNALWLSLITTTRSGQLSKDPRREFRATLLLHHCPSPRHR